MNKTGDGEETIGGGHMRKRWDALVYPRLCKRSILGLNWGCTKEGWAKRIKEEDEASPPVFTRRHHLWRY